MAVVEHWQLISEVMGSTPSNSRVLALSLPVMFVRSERREAVVRVDKPWGDVTIQRKLPPLKYYYDLEMSKRSVCVCVYIYICVCVSWYVCVCVCNGI